MMYNWQLPPGQPRYFRLSSGMIFKSEGRGGRFYLLKEDGQWEEEPRLSRIYYDVGSDYEELPPEEVLRIESERGK